MLTGDWSSLSTWGLYPRLLSQAEVGGGRTFGGDVDRRKKGKLSDTPASLEEQ